MLALSVASLIIGAHFAKAAPPGFPSSGNGLWYKTPGTVWARHFLPVGNGFIAAMTPGGTIQESTQLNIESLWSGGPFSEPSYNGGNKQPSEQEATAAAMKSLRQSVFTSKNGTITDVEPLMSPIGAYGKLIFGSWLPGFDFDEFITLPYFGLWTVSRLGHGDRKNALDPAWLPDVTARAISAIETFCSQPAQACVQNTSTSNPNGFTQKYAFAELQGLPTPSITCLDNSTLRLSGLVADPGMAYEILAKVSVSPGGVIDCTASPSVNKTIPAVNATITVSNATSAIVTWVGGTNYDINAGDATHDFSFRGPDPHDALMSLLASASQKSYVDLLDEHVTDFTATLNDRFALDLGQGANTDNPTDDLIGAYEVDKGDVYLEWLLFNFGRYLLASSARGSLPANLQGKWAIDASNPWSADYHVNINVQMNYWFAEAANLDVTQSLFDFMEKTWAPRGTYTAQVLYNISSGWVGHNELNIFGHTGMKQGDAQWADYPESNAWMMLHVWDHFDYTNDVAWWKEQGYPLIKSVAQFHLEKLVRDERFDDGTLVVVPCNSPEQPPITLGCAHAQQIIWQLFNAVEKGAAAAGEDDEDFLNEVRTKKSKMDKGVHIGSWGQLQEWKVDMDSPTDTHRHMSHLVGFYPGYALANYNPDIQNSKYTVNDVHEAVRTSLIHRGNGTGPDADSGWEKSWRAACWAQFGNASAFYHELTYLIQRNFADNLFSVYNPFDPDTIFQIDANFGYPAAVMNAVIQAPDVASTDIPLTITLLPALPPAWSTGSITGARVRGSITVKMIWDNSKPTNVTLTVDDGAASRPVRVVFAGTMKDSFTTSGGLVRAITEF